MLAPVHLFYCLEYNTSDERSQHTIANVVNDDLAVPGGR